MNVLASVSYLIMRHANRLKKISVAEQECDITTRRLRYWIITSHHN